MDDSALLSVRLHICLSNRFDFRCRKCSSFICRIVVALSLAEIISFSDKNDEFSAINAAVLAISTDSHHTHLSWTRTSRENGGGKQSSCVTSLIIVTSQPLLVGKLNIPLVADISKKISANYGVLVEDEDDAMYGAALRGLFIVDPNGVIRSIQINDDAVGRSVDETLRILKAFQWADSHVGEACPASWTPGADTIKTNPYESVEYFRSHYTSK